MKHFLFIFGLFLFLILGRYQVFAQTCVGYTTAQCSTSVASETRNVVLPYYYIWSPAGQGGYVKHQNTTGSALDRCDESAQPQPGYSCFHFLGGNSCGACIPVDQHCFTSGGPFYYPNDPSNGPSDEYWSVAFIQDGPNDYNFCGPDKLCRYGCSYIPPCTSGQANCGGYGASYGAPLNTCYTNNAFHNQTCQHNAPQTCNNTNFTNVDPTTVDNCSNTYTCSAGSCVTNLDVYVYKDYNHNGTKDAEDTTPISGITISRGVANPPTTDGSGHVQFSGLTSGSYTITMTVPAGYAATYPSAATGPTTISQTVNLGNNDGQGNQTITFLMQPLYRIQGRIYNDGDGGRCYNPPGTDCTDKTVTPNIQHQGVADSLDKTYTDSSTSVSIVGTGINQSLSQADGTYDSGYTLPAGDYKVSFTNLPTNYHMTYPLNGPPPEHDVTVGTTGKSIACSVGTLNDAKCDPGGSGDITELNFGMNNQTSHGGGFCTDIRDEVSTQDFIPNNATCGSISGQYVIMPNSSCPVTADTDPGIYYSGSITPDFGFGTATPKGWRVGGATSENFSPVNPGITRTSNSYMLTTLRNNGITPTDLSTVCTPSNCYLPDNLPSGVYQWDFDTTIMGSKDSGTGVTTNGSYTFPTGKNYVFIIGDRDGGHNSDLTLKSKILVPNGSTATFTASGNINVDASVGESDITSTAGDVEGFYSADNSFVIESNYVSYNRCNDNGSTKDLRFNLIGSATVNASGTGGSLQNQRDLCAGDLSCPTYSVGNGSGSGGDVNLGLTYFLNAPAIIKHKNSFWQELAP